MPHLRSVAPAVLLSLALVVPPTVSSGASSGPSVEAAASQTKIYDGYSYAGYGSPSGSRWNIYYDNDRVGYISHSSGSRWNVYEGYSKVGYVQRSGSKWNIYGGYSKIGYTRKSGSRSNIYAGYSRVGYAQGRNGGPVGGAALLLGLVG